MVGYQYPPLITEYFEQRKLFKYLHPETGVISEWLIFSLDFEFDAAEIQTSTYFEDKEARTVGAIAHRQAVSLSKLLAILQNQV